MSTEQSIEDIYPLSPLQQGILFDSLDASKAGVYFVQKMCRLQGDLHIPALELAWQRVVERHPVLRTSFIWEGLDEPLQIVHSDVKVALKYEDWQMMPPDQQGERLEDYIQADRRQAFDLTCAPLLRLALIRLSEDTYHFIWSHHHLLIDGWSNTLVLNEVLAFYNAFCGGGDIDLKQPRPFSNYIAYLQRVDMPKAQAFWQQMLYGFSSPTPLGVDHLPKAAKDLDEGFSEIKLPLSDNLTEELQLLARKHHLTWHTLVAGAMAILLSRYSGEEDVVFGDVFSGRPPDFEGVESMVGLFINTLPLRAQVRPETQLLSWLEELQDIQLELRQYEHTPLIQLHAWSEVPNNKPMFESILVFENYPIDPSIRDQSGSLRVNNLRPIQRPNYPVSIVGLFEPHFTLRIIFEHSRLDHDAASRMLGHFKTLLEAIAANPHRPLRDLPLLAESERRQLLEDWNNTASRYPRESCIHELLQAQADANPDSMAIEFEQHCVTYQELNRRANQLAHRLRSLAVGPDVLVGICAERSIEMVVGLVGTLKAGGAYVPLDPDYPLERLAFILNDLQPSVLLAQEKFLDQLPAFWAQVVCLDTDWQEVERYPDNNPANRCDPDNLAYVMYTSGSTGLPKGISVPHKAVVRLVRDTNYVKLDREEVFLHLAPLSFDASTLEIWGSLLNGARLVVMPPYMPTFEQLADAISAHAITTMWLTAGLFHAMVDEHLQAFSGVRQLLAGGDVLSVEHVKRVMGEVAGCKVINGYGPTENTTFSCCNPVEGEPEFDRSVPIGKPIANTRAYVLDKRMEPVPIGVAGEICVSGDGLARGYVNRADLTAEKLIPHPLTSAAGERLYRTGDVGRYGGDGKIEFIGRTDNQVKVRGYRVELGEIETVLSQHPQIKEAVVIARQEGAKGKALVGYVVERQVGAIREEQVRQYLRESLPEYFVPGRIVIVEKMPLTANSKVDRAALARMDEPRQQEPGGARARTQVEEIVRGIWEEVLGIQQVAVEENFFEMGGHSLLATQVISRIRKALKVEIELKAIFEHATVRELSRIIEAELRRGTGVEEKPIERASREAEMELSFAQQRLWFMDQLDPGNSFYNIPAAIRVSGELDMGALEKAMTEVIRRHEALRTVFRMSQGRPTQVVKETERVRMAVVDLSALGEEQRSGERKRIARQEAQVPFDLSVGPLIRMKMLQEGEQERVLLVTMHHIISDGWSIGVLVREVGKLYEAYTRGEEPGLEELKIQYRDYAAWQREYLQGEVLEKQLGYWKAQLEGAPTVLELPTDKPRPSVPNFKGAMQHWMIDGEVVEGMKQLSREESASLFMVLLAAFSVLLQRYTGRTNVVVGTPIAGRNRVETEELIGFFVNTLVLRMDLSGDPTFRELINSARATALQAYSYQDLPFEMLVQILHPERKLNYNPMFQVMFALQNAPSEPMQLPGLTVSLLQMQDETAKFDLSMTLEEVKGGLKVTAEYNTNLFYHSTIKRMLGHLQVLLEGAVSDSEHRLSDLPLMTEAERHQLLVDWGTRQTEIARPQCLHQLFELQAERNPGAAALSLDGKQISYKELNDRSNQLARYLMSLEIAPRQPIAIMLDDGLRQITALLSILKTGSPFVCLDTNYPTARLQQILEEFSSPILLTESHCLDGHQALKQHLLDDRSGRLIIIDRADGGPAQNGKSNGGGLGFLDSYPTTNLDIAVDPQDPAYIVYTSGSTGRPKGITQSHKSFSQFLNWQSNYFGMTAPGRIAQWASITYDASYCEIFGALCFGATLCLAEPAVRYDPAVLIEWMRNERVSLLQVVPSYWRQLLRTIESKYGSEGDPLPYLERMLLAGEVVPVDLVRDWLARFPTIQLFNLYGPSESVLAAYYPIRNLDPQQPSIPVGRAIDGRQILILDESQRLCPIAVAGEIYIRSQFLTSGYWQRPEETDRAYLQNPLHDDYPDPVYRTGDLGRWLPDGNIEFCGRKDHQIKIRGMRVELEDIQSVLRLHEQVSECVVVAQEFEEGDHRLVAYVVRNTDQPDSTEDREQGEMTPLESDHVSQCQVVYDEIYGLSQSVSNLDTGINLRAWVSSYTNQPLTEAEILESVNNTVNRILALRPKKMLEVGCGTGLLLFRIAPHCDEYYGTDISSTAVELLEQELAGREPKLAGVKVLQMAAHEPEHLAAGPFDMIMMNLVTQHFPSSEYLLRVLEGAVNATRPGGSIFIGSVRSLPLLKAFHTSVQLHKASSSLTREQLRQRVYKAMMADQELVIDPALFIKLKQHLPKIDRVRIELKQGRHQNEITRFEYDVTLSIGPEPEAAAAPAVSWLDWTGQSLSADEIRRLLKENNPDVLAVNGIPNARLMSDAKAVELIESDQGPETVAEIREALRKHSRADGLDPQSLWDVRDELAGDGLAYELDVNWLDSSRDGSYSAIFYRRGSGLPAGLESRALAEDLPWSHYTNNPMQGQFTLELESGLRRFLRDRLPDHAVPSNFVFMDRLPLTRTGKIDRQALPKPGAMRHVEETYVPPRTKTESVIAEVWQDVLKVDKVGVHDNFFSLGGHSLLATQVLNKIRETCSVDLQLRHFFEAPTAAGLANRIEAGRRAEQKDLSKITRMLEMVKQLPDDEARALLREKMLWPE